MPSIFFPHGASHAPTFSIVHRRARKGVTFRRKKSRWKIEKSSLFTSMVASPHVDTRAGSGSIPSGRVPGFVSKVRASLGRSSGERRTSVVPKAETTVDADLLIQT